MYVLYWLLVFPPESIPFTISCLICEGLRLMRSELRFLGTGKPMNINTRPQINRQASQKGVRMSGISSRKEFQQVIQSENMPNYQELGQQAVSVQKAGGISINVTI